VALTDDPKKNRPSWETSPWRTFQEPDSLPPPSIGTMLGTIAIAVGVGVLGYYMLDGHSHTCESCGHRWRHLGVINVGDPGSHTCGKCGTVQWWKDGVPHVFRDSIRQPLPTAMAGTLVSQLQEIRAAPRLALSSATALAWPREGSR